MRKTVTALLAVAAATAAAVAVIAPQAASASHGGQHPGSGTSSLTLVILTGADQIPNWGEQITFDVSTTATAFPHVDVTCAQNGATVYAATLASLAFHVYA